MRSERGWRSSTGSEEGATADAKDPADPALAAELVRSCAIPLRRAFEAGRAAHDFPGLAYETFAARAVALTMRRFARSGLPASRDDAWRALERIAGADLHHAIAC